MRAALLVQVAGMLAQHTAKGPYELATVPQRADLAPGCAAVILGPGGTPEEYRNLQVAVRLSDAGSSRRSHRATIRTDLSMREGQVAGSARRAVAAD